MTKCKNCNGTGRDHVPYSERCERCNGKGQNARLWRVQPPDQTPLLRSDIELIELAVEESGIVGNPSFYGEDALAAKAYLVRLGFTVEVM